MLWICALALGLALRAIWRCRQYQEASQINRLIASLADAITVFIQPALGICQLLQFGLNALRVGSVHAGQGLFVSKILEVGNFMACLVSEPELVYGFEQGVQLIFTLAEQLGKARRHGWLVSLDGAKIGF